MNDPKARIIGIARHRLSTDGNGVTTLVAFHGCPLHCQYCINPQSLDENGHSKQYTPKSLYAEICIDQLYFLATNGGVTFGGGEPCLRSQFICKFRELCGENWNINLETSLNVPTADIRDLLPVVNTLIIDIKDMNKEIYRSYTGNSNDLVIDNLKFIAEQNRQSDCVIRLPLIPNFNTESDRISSRASLEALGFTNFDLFTYLIRK